MPQQRRHMSPKYYQIIELLVTQPQLSRQEIADQVGLRPSTLKAIMGSDMFKHHLKKRQEEVEAIHNAAVAENVNGTFHLALKVCQDVLKGSPSPNFALEIVKELGQRVIPSPAQKRGDEPATSVTINISPERITDAREKARRLHSEGSKDEQRLIDVSPSGPPVREES